MYIANNPYYSMMATQERRAAGNVTRILRLLHSHPIGLLDHLPALTIALFLFRILSLR